MPTKKLQILGSLGVDIDSTLTQSGQAADAKAVGDVLAQKVDYVEGMGLSSNDFTTAEKEKLAGIETYIENYVNESILGGAW